jgi:aldose 1-epimerase
MAKQPSSPQADQWAPDPGGLRHDFFALGQQPRGTRNAGKGEKIGVVGAGDVWSKFIMPALAQRGSQVYVCDKKFDSYNSPEIQARGQDAFLKLLKEVGAQDRIEVVAGGISTLPNDLDYVLVLTPPSQHLDVIMQLMSTKRDVPIAVEKPLVATNEQLDKLQELLPYPIYCIDWQVMHALPLLEACASEFSFSSAFSGAVQTEVCDHTAYDDFAFDLRNVRKISARLVEGDANPLGDIDANRKKRPELFDFEKGGGVLFDMAVHPLNVLAVLGFRVSGVVEGFLGKPIRNQQHQYIPGVYERFGKEYGGKTGETYGRALLHMGIEGGNQAIETIIEAAKGGAATDGRIALSDERYELRWETFPTEQIGKGSGSQLEVEDLRSGRVITRSSLAADCYALIMEHISLFAKSRRRHAVFFFEHAHVIRSILDIHEHARSQRIAVGETVRQLKIDQPDIRKVALRNSNGMTVEITNFGATITAIKVPDNTGRFDDVVLGFKDAEDYKERRHPHFGGVVGRVANRIAKGRFKLGEQDYVLAQNDGENHLHGGNRGFDKAVWRIESRSDRSVTLKYVSPDGDEGYPGELTVQIKYVLNDKNELHIKYEGRSDRDTPINLSNHSYFNLKGEGRGTIADHFIQVFASKYLPVDNGLIPTGVEQPVDGTPLDLRRLKRIGDSLGRCTHEQLVVVGKGYDHNFVLDKTPSEGRLHMAARVEERQTGRVLEVETTEPGLQLYTGNFLDGSIRAKDKNSSYDRHAGLCLETQHFPDSVNHPNFPATILAKGEGYTSETIFRFSVKKVSAG